MLEEASEEVLPKNVTEVIPDWWNDTIPEKDGQNGQGMDLLWAHMLIWIEKGGLLKDDAEYITYLKTIASEENLKKLMN